MSDDVTMRRKSYDHLIRTRDRALMNVEWEKRSAKHAGEWAHQAFIEQRRLSDRLNEVCAAAASLGVSIFDINAALKTPRTTTHPPAPHSARPDERQASDG